MPPILRSLDSDIRVRGISLLIDVAREARMNAYAPYSGFWVGSAILFEDGSVSSGMNVEAVDYDGTHAEESAISAMHAARGQRMPIMIVSVGAKMDVGRHDAPIVASCGKCRQKIYELLRIDGVKDIDVVVIDPADGQPKLSSIRELLPLSFGF